MFDSSEHTASRPPIFINVLVTVGSTQFAELIEALDSEDVFRTLRSCGCENIVIQQGSGGYTPHPGTNRHGVHVQLYEYLDDLGAEMARADLVISHAGAGTIFEALRAGKRLIVVPNEALMDNHQVELAEHLASLKHLVWCKPGDVASGIRFIHAEGRHLVPYEPGDGSPIIMDIHDLLFAESDS